MTTTSISLPDELKQKAIQEGINLSLASRAGIRACLDNPDLLDTKQMVKKSILEEEINRIDRRISSLEHEKMKLLAQVENIENTLKNQRKKMKLVGEKAELMAKLNQEIIEHDFKYEQVRDNSEAQLIMKKVEMSDKELKEHIEKVRTVIQKLPY